MAYTLKDAKPLCTKPEFELVAMAHKSDLAGLGPARLRQKITRVRKIRDKFRDESARQRRESRGKSEPRGTRAAQGNERTVKKAEIFADVLTRFEAAFEASKTKGVSKKTAKKTAKKTTKKAAKKVSKKTAKKTAKKAAKKAAKKSGKKTSKKVAKKSSKKVSKKAPRATPGLSAKAVMKKAGTKMGKKVSKPTGVNPEMGYSGATGDIGVLTPDQAAPAGVTGTSKPVSAIRANFRSAGAGRAKGHAVSRSRVAQARRDSK